MPVCLDPLDYLSIAMASFPISDENNVLKKPTGTVHLRDYDTFCTS